MHSSALLWEGCFFLVSLFFWLAESVQKQIGICCAWMHLGSHNEPFEPLRAAEMAIVVPEVKFLGSLKQQEVFSSENRVGLQQA